MRSSRDILDGLAIDGRAKHPMSTVCWSHGSLVGAWKNEAMMGVSAALPDVRAARDPGSSFFGKSKLNTWSLDGMHVSITVVASEEDRRTEIACVNCGMKRGRHGRILCGRRRRPNVRGHFFRKCCQSWLLPIKTNRRSHQWPIQINRKYYAYTVGEYVDNFGEKNVSFWVEVFSFY